MSNTVVTRCIKRAVWVLLAFGTCTAIYQNLHWHCWQPRGGQAGYFWPLKDVYLYPYMNCESRWPNFSDHWPPGKELK